MKILILYYIGEGHVFEKQDIDILANINLWYMLGLTITSIFGILFISIIKPFDFIKGDFLMVKVILITGIPGAGKTTISSRLIFLTIIYLS